MLSNNNQTCSNEVANKTILVVDDVVYKGTTMKLAIESYSKKRPQKIHFSAFGKSSRFAY